MTYNEFIDKVEDGYRFKINLVKKKAYLKAPWQKYYRLVEIDKLINPTSWDVVEQLYGIYRNSIQRESKLGNYSYFSISKKERTETDIANNIDSNIAQAMLELYIMIADLKWNDNHYFWQSKKYKQLVVKKSWTTNA